MNVPKSAPPGATRLTPPENVLNDVFPPQLIARWRTRCNVAKTVGSRLEVLSASGPDPTDLDAMRRLRWLRARKAAWETYLFTAFACGMFEGNKGRDLRARLVGADDDGFRSAMAECATCWFLAGRMELHVDPNAPGRNRKNLDMRILGENGDIGVEVKAPFRERPVGTCAGRGDDADKIAQCLEAANKQLSNDALNLLVIAPTLQTDMFSDRRELIRAVYGKSVIAFDFNAEAGTLENLRGQFSPRGKFLNTLLPGGRKLKQDGLPACRRIGGILCIEERVREKYPWPAEFLLAVGMAERDRGELFRIFKRKRDLCFSRENEMWIDHNVLILHNPHAYHRISVSTWNGWPQLVPSDNGMMWTDGYDARV